MLMDAGLKELIIAQKKRGYQKKWLPIVVVILLAAITVAVVIIVYTQKNSGPLSKYASQIGFPLYYPSRAKNFFQLNKQSVTSQAGLFTYTGNYRAASMTVAEQPMPSQFDYNIISSAKEITAKIGKIYTTDLGDRPTGIIITDRTLVTISSPTADINVIEQFAQEF